MPKSTRKQVDLEIDKLTNSIENTVTGDSFATVVVPVTKDDLKLITKKKGWLFNWAAEFKQPDRTVYKLTIEHNPGVIQGLVSITDKGDSIFLDLVESASFNVGKTKMYLGVPGNLFAFACKVSFEKGYNGYVSFVSKTKLVTHYINLLNATPIGGNKLIIEEAAATELINKYFPKQ